MKKLMSIILAIALLGTGFSTFSVSATQEDNDSSVDNHINVITEKLNDDNTVTYFDENNNEVDVDSFNGTQSYTKSLPKSFDLRDFNRNTSVKDQGQEGLCWDFGSTAAIESNILTQTDLCKNLGNEPCQTLDLSEAGNAWYIHTNFSDKNSELYNEYIQDPQKGGNGGRPNYIAAGLSSGYGTYPESLMPYDNWEGGYPQEYRFYSDYRLKNFTVLDKDTDYIKSRIKECGGATVSYNSFRDNYNIKDGIENYYDNGNPIHYDESNMTHLVEIMGWDDNYSKDNFNTEMQPQHNGAWLCKNSWGESNPLTYDKKYVGYFWMSYENFTYDITQFEMQSTDNFDNIYQNQIESQSISEVNGASNIFTAKSNQTVKQVNISTVGENTYTISLYKLNENYSTPTDGTLLTSFKNTVQTTGCYSVECPDTVNLQKGDTFSVVVTSNDILRINCSSNSDNTHIKNRSFLKNTNNEWINTTDEYYNFGAAAIKVYTSNSNGIDKSQLNELVQEASSQTYDEKIDKQLINSIKEELNNSKNLLNNDKATQQQINNQYCLLNVQFSKIKNYFYNINSMQDYYTLKEMYNNGCTVNNLYINTDLDFKNEDQVEPLFSNTLFCGTIIGNNHIIKNANIYGCVNFSSFFGKLQDASVDGITFENVSSCGENGTAIFASLLKNCNIKNVSIYNSYVSSKDSNVGLVAENIKDTTFDNLTIHNCSSDLAALAGIFAAKTFENNTLNNCDIKDNVLKATDKVIDSNQRTLDVTGNNFNFKSIITLNNDKCTIEQAFGVIDSITCQDKELVKTDGKYNVDMTDNMLLAMVHYQDDESVEHFEYNIDNNFKSITLTAYNCSNKDLIIPETIGGIPVKVIESNFKCEDNDSIEKIIFSNSVEAINEYSLNNYNNLKSVSFGNGLKKIYNSSFMNCKLLNSVKFPDSLEYIGDNCFAGCGFKYVTLGRNLSYLGENSFGYTNFHGLNDESIKINDFVINGYSNTLAQQYADTNGYKFINLNTSTPYATDELYDYSVFCKGDCNKDGTVNVNDVTTLQKYIVGLEKFDKIQEYNALISEGSCTITISCATTIQKMICNI